MAPCRNRLISLEDLERARRIERPTLTLARLCSTPELRPHSKWEAGYRLGRVEFQAACAGVVNFELRQVGRRRVRGDFGRQSALIL